MERKKLLSGSDSNFDVMTVETSHVWVTVKILKFGTPQTIAMIVLKIEMFAVTLH